MPSRPQHKAGVVLMDGGVSAPEHEQAVHQGLAIRLATLLGTRFIDQDEALHVGDADFYYLPSRTLIDSERHALLGIRSEQDLFGGVVDYPFMATKAISHTLPPGFHSPHGWTDAFAETCGDALLYGWTVFSVAEARVTAKQMLQTGAVRLKPVRATAGRGQVVVRDRAGLDAALAAMNDEELAVWGLVLEQNLTEVETFSVGQVRVAGITASYFGTQQLTRDNAGEEVYGGSTLTVVRGDYRKLLALDLDDPTRLAIEQATRYDCAADKHLAGFFASRRNYDIARGKDEDGLMRSGVLEQSWRVGGASSAEVLALEAFAGDAKLAIVNASTHEVFGDCTVPDTATLFYQGDDAEVGRISKYAQIGIYEHP
jgi:hypothetical protein